MPAFCLALLPYYTHFDSPTLPATMAWVVFIFTFLPALPARFYPQIALPYKMKSGRILPAPHTPFETTLPACKLPLHALPRHQANVFSGRHRHFAFATCRPGPRQIFWVGGGWGRTRIAWHAPALPAAMPRWNCLAHLPAPLRYPSIFHFALEDRWARQTRHTWAFCRLGKLATPLPNKKHSSSSLIIRSASASSAASSHHQTSLL